jgi:hypothetical protein
VVAEASAQQARFFQATGGRFAPKLDQPPLRSTHRKQGSASFWKKKQKLMILGVRVVCNAYPKYQKFFGSFFQKRTACLHLP